MYKNNSTESLRAWHFCLQESNSQFKMPALIDSPPSRSICQCWLLVQISLLVSVNTLKIIYLHHKCLTNILPNIFFYSYNMLLMVITRPGVAWAVLQTPLSLIDYLTDWVTSPFPPNIVVYTTRLLTLNKWELKTWNFLKNFHLPPCVTCYVSNEALQKKNIVALVCGGSVIDGAYPV